MAEMRLSEAGSADIVITACPFCVSNLRSDSDGKRRIADLTEIVDELL
jgi:Fe-S oxidoreductase